MVLILNNILFKSAWFNFKLKDLYLQNSLSSSINLHKQSTFLEITTQKQVHNFQVTTVDDHHLKSRTWIPPHPTAATLEQPQPKIIE